MHQEHRAQTSVSNRIRYWYRCNFNAQHCIRVLLSHGSTVTRWKRRDSIPRTK